ncbi:TPA: transporter substrate-binding domain-containing protein [Legionella pneumophila subsp. fraseri]|nr:transporter substrate-binding domain-containing protein [Legionella pneumophila]HBC0466374.1 transporter substrate-binding domain-containing protein [Legionella pneumophila]
MTFDTLFSELANDKIDLAIAVITITNERQQQYLFSLPYLPSNGRS